MGDFENGRCQSVTSEPLKRDGDEKHMEVLNLLMAKMFQLASYWKSVDKPQGYLTPKNVSWAIA